MNNVAPGDIAVITHGPNRNKRVLIGQEDAKLSLWRREQWWIVEPLELLVTIPCRNSTFPGGVWTVGEGSCADWALRKIEPLHEDSQLERETELQT